MAPSTENHDEDDSATTTAKKKKTQTYPHISTLPVPLLPTDPATPRRLIIVGDVHGHLGSLEALLRKARFSRERGDALVLAGDLVNKGPDSAGVVALAMRVGAFGVRGNHEDRVLSAWEHYVAKRRKAGKEVGIDGDGDEEEEEEVEKDRDEQARSAVEENGNGKEDDFLLSEDLEEEESDVAEIRDGEEEPASEEDDDVNPANHGNEKRKKKKKGKDKGKKKKGKGKKKSKDRKPRHSDLATAKSLSPEHRAWLGSLPLILRIGDLGPRYGEVVVVHAGLVPGIPLESQDPDAVMTMRTLLPSSGSDDLSPNSDSGSDSVSDSRLVSSPHFDTTTADPNNETQEPFTTTQTQHEDPENQTTEANNKHKNKNKHQPPHKPMIPSASRAGIPWAEIWTSYQTSIISSPPSPPPDHGQHRIRPATVVYGHDAKAGLRMRRYAFGLDSGCGRGEALTAVVFELVPAPAVRGGLKGEEMEEEAEDASEYQNHNLKQNQKQDQDQEEAEREWTEEDGEEDEQDDDGDENGEVWDVDTARKERTSTRTKTKTRIRHRLVSVSCAEA